VATGSGAVLVEGASLWLDCEVHDELPAGDHEIVLLRITAVHPRPEVPPLVFHGSRFTALAG
jgi:flavin reductase (DIM6/NTAB) family NADH-FMN oxidoreductase RutF